jgi:predicted peptidase
MAAALILICVATPSRAATDLSNSITGSVSDGSTSIPYRLFQPQGVAAGDKVPLVIFLHGMGDRGTDNVGQTYWMNNLQQQTASGQYAAYVLAPQINTNMWFASNSNTPTIAESLTMDALKQVEAELPANVDTSRIYITGVSMGSFGTWDMARLYQNTFAAAVPMSGGIDPSYAPALKNTPIWAFHGSADPVVPVQTTRDMVAALQAIGGNIKYTEVAGGGHEIWPEQYANPALYAWMFSQQLAGANGVTDPMQPTLDSAAASTSIAVAAAPVPEPASFLLLALAGCAAMLRRRRLSRPLHHHAAA